MIARILGDDVEIDGSGEPQLAEGTATDRIISIEDSEMRHGRKSAAHKFNGYKTSTSIDQTSALILDIADLPASEGDGKALIPSIARVEVHVGVIVESVICDGAYGSSEIRAACAERSENPIELLSPMRRPADPEVDKSAFEVVLDAHTATCPRGQTVSASSSKTDKENRTTHKFIFDRATCLTCPLFARCIHSKTTGRTPTTSYYENYLRDTRQRQQTDEFKQRYCLRLRVEGKQAKLVTHGLRNTRYVGEAKRNLQQLYLGAAVNLKRIAPLVKNKGIDLLTILANSSNQLHQACSEIC